MKVGELDPVFVAGTLGWKNHQGLQWRKMTGLLGDQLKEGFQSGLNALVQ